MTAIKLENVFYAYEADEGETPVNAVDGVSLEIEEGSFVAVVGHNGSGKSTLARLLNGLLLPDKGTVTVFGTDTKDEKKIYSVRSAVGMVFQNPDNQMVASVVEDDIAFGPENLGLPREEIIKRVDWALEQVGMAEYRKSTPFRMSGGQKQRLAIAGVLGAQQKGRYDSHSYHPLYGRSARSKQGDSHGRGKSRPRRHAARSIRPRRRVEEV